MAWGGNCESSEPRFSDLESRTIRHGSCEDKLAKICTMALQYVVFQVNPLTGKGSQVRTDQDEVHNP